MLGANGRRACQVTSPELTAAFPVQRQTPASMISASTDRSNTRLSFCLGQRLRLHGQLQHACTLTYEEMREQHDLAIRELKSIMVRLRIV
jgi:hypothetical protein